jgi:AcrR family transcriptional regulator
VVGQEAAGGRQPRRRLGAAARRETILAAAVPAFAAAGYDQTRVADIAAEVGVTEPVVFQNFGTKAGLFIAVLDRVSERTASRLAALDDDVPEALARLMAAEHLDRAHSRGATGILFLEAAGHAEPRIREAGQRAAARVAEAVAALLRRGQADGSIRADADPTALAWLVLSMARAREFRRVHDAPSSPTLEDELLAAVLALLRRR